MNQALSSYIYQGQLGGPCRPCHFIVPDPYSKSICKEPLQVVNASAARWPALAAEAWGGCFKVAFFISLVEMQRPWMVHPSWLVFADAGSEDVHEV